MARTMTVKRRSITRLPSIPQEIIEENILPRLPVKSISRFRCVCKYWRDHLFRNRNFIRSHLNHAIAMNEFNLLVSEYKIFNIYQHEAGLYSIDHDVLSALSSRYLGEAIGEAREIDRPFRAGIHLIHGSCNGLVCVKTYGNDICIWNPSTNEYKQVPKTPVEFPSVQARYMKDSYRTAYGFGYDCKIDDYKLLRIVDFHHEEDSQASVYTLGTNSWRSLGPIPYHFGPREDRGILVDGTLHWLADANSTETDQDVVSFDIGDETFCSMPLPDYPCGFSELGTWDGKLCLELGYDENDFTVWTMEDYTWRKQLDIIPRMSKGLISGTPIQIFQNGEILFDRVLHDEEEEGNIGLVSYDPKLKRARVLKICGLTHNLEIEPYIGTLVSPNSSTLLGKNK